MSAKDETGKMIVQAGAGIGGAVGGVVTSAAVSNIAAASVATASSAALASGPFAAFGGVVFHPATWAVMIVNPIGSAVVLCGLTGLGAYGAYKIAQKVLD
jgi:hypothetical protein